MTFDYEDLVKTYLDNRKRKSDLKKEYDAKVKEIDEFQELIEGFFAAESIKTKLKNFKTDFGTAYKYRAASVRTEDKAKFTKFIIDNHLFKMADIRPVKADALTWLDDCGFAPPGVKIERFDKIGVLSPGQK